MGKIIIDGSGRLPLPGPAAREIGDAALELVSRSPRHLLFTVPAGDGAVVLAGRFGEIAIADLLSFLHMFRKTGILSLALPGGSKDLYFQNGDIAFAASTFPEEELGEVLLAAGKVDRDSLHKARRFATARTSVGKILVEQGTLAPKELWIAVRQQVETIVYTLFACQQGSFSYVAKDLEQEDIPRLSLSTQNLIMEGLRRVDERALFMRRIRSLDDVPVLTDAAGDAQTAVGQRLLDLVRPGGDSAREVLRKSGMVEFEALRLLYQMVERGWVRLEQAPSVAVGGELGEMLAIFNGALTTICRRISGTCPAFHQELRLFLRDLPQPFSFVFRDVGLKEDGTVDSGRILANLAGLEEEDGKKLLVDALNELLFMACLAARRELGSAESAELTQRVQEISRRLKQLTGRNE